MTIDQGMAEIKTMLGQHIDGELPERLVQGIEYVMVEISGESYDTGWDTCYDRVRQAIDDVT